MPKRRAVLLLVGLLAGRAVAQAPTAPSLAGSVRDSAGAPLRDVEIAIDSSAVLARSDTLGRFTLGHLAAGEHLLRFDRPGWVPMRLRVEIPPSSPEPALALGDVVLRAAPPRVLSVSIAFTDATSGRAVEGVVVSVGRRVVGYGDRQGRFRNQGLRLLEGEEWSFRRLGYQPTAFDFWPAEGQSALDLAVKLKPIAITLGPVIVEGDVSRALTPWMKDFEQRRHLEHGIFLDRQDVLKHQSSLTATNLLSWAGVQVQGDVLNGRMLRVWGACPWIVPNGGPPLIFLDGVRLDEQTALDWLDMYSPEQVAGVEVYNSPAKVPLMYNATGSECGVIAVWTKR